MSHIQFRIRTIVALIAVAALYLTPALLLGGDPYLFILLTACLVVPLARSTRTAGGGTDALREHWRLLLERLASSHSRLKAFALTCPPPLTRRKRK
jgi:hypothetical protein